VFALNPQAETVFWWRVHRQWGVGELPCPS